MYKSITGTSAPTPPPFFKSPIFCFFSSSFYSISSFFLPILIRKILLCLTIDDVGKDVDDEERRRRKKNREDVVVGWLNGGVSVIGEWDEAKKRRAWICSSSKDKQKWLIDWHSSVQAPPLATLQFQLYVTTVVAVATPPPPSSPMVCFSDLFSVIFRLSLLPPKIFFFRFFQLPPPLTTNRYSTQRRKGGGE